MNALWLALGIVFIIEGMGPMLFPTQWQNLLKQMSETSEKSMRRLGGCLVVAGVVMVYWMMTQA